MPDLEHLPKVDPSVLHKEGHIMWATNPTDSWQKNYIWPLVPSQGYPWGLRAVDTFSGYAISVPVWSANSGNTIVVLETNPGQVFGCLDIYSLTMVCFLSQATQQWTDSQAIWWTFHASWHPWASGIVELWNGVLDNWLNNVSNSTSLTSSWSTHLTQTIRSLNATLPRRGSVSLSCFLGND